MGVLVEGVVIDAISGTSQGSAIAISALLANIALHALDRAWIKTSRI